MVSRKNLPSISALLALEALDRLGSASSVAVELSLTQGAISRQIQAIEAQLGVELVIRERQRLSLTPAAKDYVQDIRKALRIMTDASMTLRANPGGGSLNLSILPGFGMLWLAPKLHSFTAAHPDVAINLSTRLRPFDFTQSNFDAAVHYGRQDWSGVSYMKLMDEEIIAVGAAGLVKQPLTTAQDALSYPLLQIEGRSGDWGRWLAHHNLPGLRPPAMLFDQFSTMAQAAQHGLGLALLPTFMIKAELAEGRLLPAFGPPIQAAGAYYLVWPEHMPIRAPLRSFLGWLKQRV